VKQRDLNVFLFRFTDAKEKVSAGCSLREFGILTRRTSKASRLDKFSRVLYAGSSWHGLEQTLDESPVVPFDRLISKIVGECVAPRGDDGNRKQGSHSVPLLGVISEIAFRLRQSGVNRPISPFH
jgi:hypothetical protein